MDVDGIPLPVLDGTNYRQWKLRMRCILEAKELHRIVYDEPTASTSTPAAGPETSNAADGTSETTEVKVTIQDEKASKLRECKAKMILVCAVDSKHTVLIESCRTAREIWKRLEIEYADKEPTSIDNIMIEYYTYKKEPNQGISEYIAQIDSYACKLEELGRELTSSSIMAKLVSGLTPEYAAFRRAWDMTPSQFKSKDLLIANLKKEEKCLKATGMINEAYVTRSAHKGPRSNKKRNHTSIDDKKKKTKCAWCHKVGHWWKECPDRPADQIPSSVKNKSDQKANSDKPQEQAQQPQKGVVRAFTAASGWGPDDGLYLDSGATVHQVAFREWFEEGSLAPLPEAEPIRVANGQFMHAVAKGNIKATATINGTEHPITLRDVRYVPKITDNLISLGVLDKLGMRTTFSGGKVTIYKNNTIMCTGQQSDDSNLYKLDIKVKTPHRSMIARAERTAEEWHSVLGHADMNQIEKMEKSGCVEGMKVVSKPRRELESCADCQLGKGHCSTHSTSHRPRATAILERVHMDLVGPINPPSCGGMMYFLLLRDEYSTYSFVEFVSCKSHVQMCIKRFVNDVSTLTQECIKILRSDNGTEFKNQGMSFFCAKEGITQEFSAPRTPQQNGEAERANRTIIETARAMLQASGLPLNMWAEAINTAVYVRNRTLNTRSDGKTPYELFYGRRPNLAHLVKFGQEVHVLDHEKKESKFSPKTQEAFVVGYAGRVNTYRCLIPDSDKVIISSDVVPAAHKPKVSQVSKQTPPFITFMVDRHPPADAPAESSPSSHRSVSGIDLPETTVEDARRQCTAADPFPQESNDQTIPISEAATNANINDAERHMSTEVHVQAEAAPELPPRTTSLQPSSADAAIAPIHVPSQIPNVRPRVPTAAPRTTQAAVIRSNAPTAPATQVIRHINPTVSASGAPQRAPAPANPSRVTATTVTGRPTNTTIRPAQASGLSPSAIVSRLTQAVRQSRPKRNVKSTYMRNMISRVDLNQEPKSYAEAISCADSCRWVSAINTELSAHDKNGTWKIVPKPEGVDETTAKWIFKIKQEGDAPVRYKARLVARGFTQIKGVDYDEVFAPVVRIESIRLLFALCVQYEFEYAQFDITTAFLNGEVKEELYLEPPEGLDVPEGYTCRLIRSLYGLKQAPRCWHEKFTSMLKLFNMKQTFSDPCVFVGTSPELIYLALYVDDGLIFAKNRATIDRLIGYLTKHFEVKQLDTKCFLGLEIVQDREKRAIFLHQKHYIERTLARFNMSEAKPAVTPLETAHSLNKPATLEQPALEDVPYAEALGSLMYCAATRPDLSHCLSVLSKYQKSPREAHWQAIKRALRYLKGTLDHGIMYQRVEDPSLLCFTDADWAGDQSERRSMSGMITTIGYGPISFKARQQSVVALSTAEAEYMAAGVAVQELIWLQRFLNELQVPITEKPRLFCDNTSAILIIKNPENHERTKHIDIKYHFIREVYQEGKFDVEYVPTGEQMADIFTKALPSPKHNMLKDAIGCVSVSELTSVTQTG